jgi:uncharacterized protein
MSSSLGLFVLNTVLVPGAVLRLHVFEDRYKSLMADCIERRLPFGVLLDREGNEVGEDLNPFTIGTTAVIRQVSRLAGGRLYVVAVGGRRFKVERLVTKVPYWRADISYLQERAGDREARTLRDLALERFRDYLEMLLSGCSQELDSMELPVDAVAASYVIADALQIETCRKQMLLEKASASARLRTELALLEDETQRLRQVRARSERDEQNGRVSPFVARFSRN